MSGDDKVTPEPPWWLAVHRTRWPAALALLMDDPAFWSEILTTAGAETVRVFPSGEHLHLLLPAAQREVVRAWLVTRRLRLTELPARRLEDLPVFVAETERVQ